MAVVKNRVVICPVKDGAW